MEREQIVSRATTLANEIRVRRSKFSKDVAALALFNNLNSECVSYLKEVRFFLDRENTSLAEKYLVEAEHEFARFTSRKGGN